MLGYSDYPGPLNAHYPDLFMKESFMTQQLKV